MKSEDFSKILTEVTIDYFNFQVTWNPFEKGSSILWFRDTRKHIAFSALGKFSGFNKRGILDFVVRYSTSNELRSEIEHKKFEKKLSSISLSYFDQIELESFRNKERAYKNLFELDFAISKQDLAKRRKMMTRKFHPDVGGDDKAMAIINDAYDFLSTRASR